MTGVPRHIAEHHLNVREGCLPIRQKKRGQAPERNKAIQEEVEKLVDAGIMKEVHYHSWLSNPIMVKKHDGSWRMCVDFKDLKKACPQDGYPLPEIDWKVESLCGYPLKCLLDAYKGCYQIKMAEEDEEKTAFIMSQGIFSYTKMPFDLKNVGATYQRLVDRAFQNLNDRKGGQANASVLCEPRPMRAGDQLHPHGKTGVSIAQRKQVAEKILPDGSSCIDGFGAGLILTNSEGVEFTYAMRFRFEATNNEAEYEALIAGLRIAEQMGVKNLQAKVDSWLVANQVNGSYVAKESGMVQYLEKVKKLTSNFKEFSIKQVPRSKNKKADALSKITSTSFAHLSKQVLLE
ncbi:reverse transcriptase domain-containing protein [Tanacetum coccineum]